MNRKPPGKVYRGTADSMAIGETKKITKLVNILIVCVSLENWTLEQPCYLHRTQQPTI